MLSIVRWSQVQGLTIIDGSTASYLGDVEAIWLDTTGKIAYISAKEGYIPLEQVSDIHSTALSTYGRLVINPPSHVQRLEQLAVQSVLGDVVGQIEDVLFDWHTGEIDAYVLVGEIAEPWGEQVVLYPHDVVAIAPDALTLREGVQGRLKPASEALDGFLSEKSQQVRHLVKEMSDRLHHLVSPHDQQEVVHVKIKDLSHEMAASGEHDHHALHDATIYLHEQWEHLQHIVTRSGQRAKTAMGSAWKHLTGHSEAND